jgi:hypothetical protein
MHKENLKIFCSEEKKEVRSLGHCNLLIGFWNSEIHVVRIRKAYSEVKRNKKYIQCFGIRMFREISALKIKKMQ